MSHLTSSSAIAEKAGIIRYQQADMQYLLLTSK